MAAQPRPHVASSLLERAHSPDTAATIFQEKVKQRPLLLRPTPPDPTANARSKRQHDRLWRKKAEGRKKNPKPLSAKKKRALCLDEIPNEQQKYSIYEPLHGMWCGYMRDILGLGDGTRSYLDPQGAGPILASADYHGALLQVVRSRCTSRVGITGIVLRDTRFTFELITKSNEVKTVPKEHTVFGFEVPPEQGQPAAQEKTPLVFEIMGSQFQTRAADRAKKKFRLHFDPDL